MLPRPYHKAKCRSWLELAGYVLTQPKLAGHHGLFIDGKLLSREDHEITGLPLLLQDLRSMRGKWTLEGELYIHGMTADELNSVIERPEPHPAQGAVVFWIFDVPSPLMMVLRAKGLDNLPAMRRVRAVPTARARTTAEVGEHLEGWLAKGREGLVVRHPYAFWRPGKSRDAMKWKPGRSDRYLVLEALPGRGRLAGQLGALRLADAQGNQFKVAATGQSAAARRKLWEARAELPG